MNAMITDINERLLWAFSAFGQYDIGPTSFVSFFLSLFLSSFFVVIYVGGSGPF
jgi:hypothetical protein